MRVFRFESKIARGLLINFQVDSEENDILVSLYPMRTNELSEEEFKLTMSGMRDVTETGDATVDIWKYVAQLVDHGTVPNIVYDNNIVEYVYRNDSQTFDHVLLPIESPNAFVVVVVDLIRECVYGHYSLDLNKEYGLE